MYVHTYNNVANLLRKIFVYGVIVTLKYFRCLKNVKAKKKTRMDVKKNMPSTSDWKKWGMMAE